MFVDSVDNSSVPVDNVTSKTPKVYALFMRVIHIIHNPYYYCISKLKIYSNSSRGCGFSGQLSRFQSNCGVLIKSILTTTLCCVVLSTNLSTVFAQDPQWEGIVVHHSASGPNTTAADINRWHKERGFDGIGYHFVILPSGKIEIGRSLSRNGAHALNPSPSRNRTHIGVVLIDSRKNSAGEWSGGFTDQQYSSLGALHRELEGRFGVLPIERHHEACPGDGFRWELMTLSNNAEERG